MTVSPTANRTIRQAGRRERGAEQHCNNDNEPAGS